MEILEQKFVHEAGDDSFTLPDIDDFEEVGRIAKSFFDGVKAFLEYFGNSRKDEDIIDFYHRGEEGIQLLRSSAPSGHWPFVAGLH